MKLKQSEIHFLKKLVEESLNKNKNKRSLDASLDYVTGLVLLNKIIRENELWIKTIKGD